MSTSEEWNGGSFYTFFPSSCLFPFPRFSCAVFFSHRTICNVGTRRQSIYVVGKGGKTIRKPNTERNIKFFTVTRIRCECNVPLIWSLRDAIYAATKSITHDVRGKDATLPEIAGESHKFDFPPHFISNQRKQTPKISLNVKNYEREVKKKPWLS